MEKHEEKPIGRPDAEVQAMPARVATEVGQTPESLPEVQEPVLGPRTPERLKPTRESVTCAYCGFSWKRKLTSKSLQCIHCNIRDWRIPNPHKRVPLCISSLQQMLKYARITESECWEWTRGKTSHGYGVTYFNGKLAMVHRIAWSLANSEPYPDKESDICHKCDNPPCFNPDHLFKGDRSINMRDCVDKGRHTQHESPYCRRGHPRTEDNLYVYKSKNGRNRYVCKKCNTERTVRWQRKKRAQQK